MNEPAEAPVADDEIRLGQLACQKLAGLVEGALTIGLPALVTGCPEPRDFLSRQFALMSSFAQVLHTVAQPPGTPLDILQLRQHSLAVSNAVAHLRTFLDAALDERPVPSRSLDPIPSAALALYDRLEEYSRLIHADRSRLTPMKEVVGPLVEGVRQLARPR